MGASVSLVDKSGVYVDVAKGTSAAPSVERRQGAPSIFTGQASVGTTVSVIIPARTVRSSLTLINESTTVVRYGPAGVTLANGAYLAGVVGASVTLDSAAAIYAIVATGTAAVSFVETY